MWLFQRSRGLGEKRMQRYSLKKTKRRKLHFIGTKGMLKLFAVVD